MTRRSRAALKIFRSVAFVGIACAAFSFSAGVAAASPFASDGTTPPKVAPLIEFSPRSGLGTPEPNVAHIFDDMSQWPVTASHIFAYNVAQQWFQYNSEADIATLLDGLSARNIPLEINGGLLDTPAGCAPGEGLIFGQTLSSMQILKSHGANVMYFDVDESFSAGIRCGMTPDQIAQNMAKNVAQLRQLYPGIIIGDTEPVGGGFMPSTFQPYATAYRNYVGTPLAWFKADINWSDSNWINETLQTEQLYRGMGIPFGFIINGWDNLSASGWPAAAISHIQAYENAGGRPDLVSIATWNPYPDHLVPETDGTSLTYVANAYITQQRSIWSSTNPCVIPAGQTTCAVYVSWSAPASQVVQVWVKTPYTGYQLLGCTGGGGNLYIPWIATTGDTFSLYNTADCTANDPTSLPVVDRVTVVGIQDPPPTISASPNPCTIAFGATTCATTLSWTVPYFQNNQIWVKTPSSAPQYFSCTADNYSTTVPWITSAGDTFLMYRTKDCDPTSVIGRYVDASVTVGGVAQALPDLSADTMPDTSAFAGMAKAFSATIRNSGNASTQGNGGIGNNDGTFKNFYQVQDPSGAIADYGVFAAPYLSPSSVGPLSAGGVATVSFSYTFASAGTYHVRVCADDDWSGGAGWINESNGGNNCGNWAAITVASPDPAGYFDAATCTSFDGWAYDPKSSATSIQVDLYSDGAFVGAYPTNVYRSDVNAAYGITGNHGFSITTPNQLKDGKTHSLTVYAINTNGAGPNPLLGGAPRTITCAPPPVLWVNPTSIGVGGSVVTTWKNIPNPSSNDWFALYLKGATTALTRRYVNCATTPSVAVPSGKCSLMLPSNALPGTYVWMLHSYLDSKFIAVSQAMAVQ